MDEIDAEIAQLEAQLASMEARLSSLPPPSPMEQIESGITWGNVKKGAGNAIRNLASLPSAIGEGLGAINDVAEENPTLSALSLGTYPVAKAAVDYFGNKTPQEAILAVAEPIASVVPGYVETMRAARASPTGKVPFTEIGENIGVGIGEVGTNAALSYGLSKLPGGIQGAKHRIVGKSPEYSAFETLQQDAASTAIGSEMGASVRAYESKTPGGGEMADRATEGFSVLAKDPDGAKLISEAPATAVGYEQMQEGFGTLKDQALVDRIKLLKDTETKAQELNIAKSGDPIQTTAVGVASAQDLNKALSSLDAQRAVAADGGVAMDAVQSRYLDDLIQKTGLIRRDNPFSDVGFIADGVGVNELQRRIQQIDNELKAKSVYDLVRQGNVDQGRIALAVNEESALKATRGVLQTILRDKVKEIGGDTAVELYNRSNAIYGAVSKVDPVLSNYGRAADYSKQAQAQQGLLPAIRSVGGAIVEGANRLMGNETSPIALKRRAIEDMQRALSVYQGQPLPLISRTFEALSQNADNIQKVAFIAQQIGMVADPQEFLAAPKPIQKQIFNAVVQADPHSFESPVSGLPSEIDGKIQDPFDQDFYLQEQYDKHAADPSARADILGPFLSNRKVAMQSPPIDRMQMDKLNILELAPQVDGGFGLPSTMSMVDKGQKSEYYTLEEMIRAQQGSYQ